MIHRVTAVRRIFSFGWPVLVRGDRAAVAPAASAAHEQPCGLDPRGVEKQRRQAGKPANAARDPLGLPRILHGLFQFTTTRPVRRFAGFLTCRSAGSRLRLMAYIYMTFD